jgi:hypothetical protein
MDKANVLYKHRKMGAIIDYHVEQNKQVSESQVLHVLFFLSYLESSFEKRHESRKGTSWVMGRTSRSEEGD